MPRPPPSPPPAPGRTTLAQLAAATPPPRPVALPIPPDGSNPLGDAWCGVPEPDAGRSAHRRDYGVVAPSAFPAEATQWASLELHRFYDAPARTLAAPAAPSPRVTLAFGPQSSATRHAVRVLRHERAQTLRAPGEPELPAVAVASYVADAMLLATPVDADADPDAGPAERPEVGVRADGPTWPPHVLPPAAAFLAAHRPWWVRPAADAGPPPPCAPPPPARTLACAGQRALPPPQDGRGEAACVALALTSWGGARLPLEALAARFGAVRELSIVDAAGLRSLEGLLAALPALRRLVLVRCPALVDLGEAPAAFAARVELAAVVACPAFAPLERLVTAARQQPAPP